MKVSESNSKEFMSTLSVGVDFEIADESQGKIIEALSKNIYKDPIGSIVREYCSNAWDANVEAGVDRPIIVKLNSDVNGCFFSVTDFGVGMSEQRVNEIFTKYGKSTKSNSNNEIGGFGIGAKCAFSYVNTFYVNTVYNKVLYNFVVSKTDDKPTMICISKKESEEFISGTEVRIYLKSYHDVIDFKNKIKRQLLHFPNVVVEIDGEVKENIISEKLFEDRDIIIAKESDYFSKPYAVVGPVSYPLEQAFIDNFYKLPTGRSFGIKFEIGELDVTLSREELRYSERTIKTIKDKIEQLHNKFSEIYKNESRICKDPIDYISKYRKFDSFNIGGIELSKPSGNLKSRNFKLLPFLDDVKYEHLKNPQSSVFRLLYKINQYGYLCSKGRELYMHNYSFCKSIVILAEPGDKNIIKKAKKIFNERKPGDNREVFVVTKQKNLYNFYREVAGRDKVSSSKNILYYSKLINKHYIQKIEDTLIKSSSIVLEKAERVQRVRCDVVEKHEGVDFYDLDNKVGKSFKKLRYSDGDFQDLSKTSYKTAFVYCNWDDVDILLQGKRRINSDLLNLISKDKIQRNLRFISFKNEKCLEVIKQDSRFINFRDIFNSGELMRIMFYCYSLKREYNNQSRLIRTFYEIGLLNFFNKEIELLEELDRKFSRDHHVYYSLSRFTLENLNSGDLWHPSLRNVNLLFKVVKNYYKIYNKKLSFFQLSDVNILNEEFIKILKFSLKLN